MRMRACVLVFIALGLASAAWGRAGLPSHNPANLGGAANPSACATANVLDSLSASASAAYSVRKLRAAYAGSALRVYRDSDATQHDVGFDSNCYLDTADMLTFCAATNCQIAKWYDQSGNARDLLAFSTAATTARIVTGGTLSASIGAAFKVAMTMDGSQNNRLVVNSGTVVGTTQGTVFAVANATSGSAGNATASWWQIQSLLGATSSTANGAAINFGFVQTGALYSPPAFMFTRYTGQWLSGHTDMHASVTYTYGTDKIFMARYNTADGSNRTKAYISGGSPSTENTATANDAAVNFIVGNGGNIAQQKPFLGQFAEVITFLTQITVSDTNLLGNNQNSWYGLSWTNIS